MTLPDVKVDDAGRRGRGVFTEADIAAGAFVTEYPQHYSFDIREGMYDIRAQSAEKLQRKLKISCVYCYNLLALKKGIVGRCA